MKKQSGTSVHPQDRPKLNRSTAHENLGPVLGEKEVGKDRDVVDDHQTIPNLSLCRNF